MSMVQLIVRGWRLRGAAGIALVSMCRCVNRSHPWCLRPAPPCTCACSAACLLCCMRCEHVILKHTPPSTCHRCCCCCSLLQDLGVGATPALEKKRSRWDETPAAGAAAGYGATPAAIGGAFGATPAFTPMGAAGLETPAVPGMVGAPGGMTPDQWHADKAAREMYERNRPLSDEELDAMLPGPEQVRHVGQLNQQQHCRGLLSVAHNRQVCCCWVFGQVACAALLADSHPPPPEFCSSPSAVLPGLLFRVFPAGLQDPAAASRLPAHLHSCPQADGHAHTRHVWRRARHPHVQHTHRK